MIQNKYLTKIANARFAALDLAVHQYNKRTKKKKPKKRLNKEVSLLVLK